MFGSHANHKHERWMSKKREQEWIASLARITMILVQAFTKIIADHFSDHASNRSSHQFFRFEEDDVAVFARSIIEGGDSDSSNQVFPFWPTADFLCPEPTD